MPFILYINDLETGLKLSSSKSSDDTMVGGGALTTPDYEATQIDPDQIIQWPEKWEMVFNVYKCIAVHYESRKSNKMYSMSKNQHGRSCTKTRILESPSAVT